MPPVGYAPFLSTVDLSTVDWRRDPTSWQVNLAPRRWPAIIACNRKVYLIPFGLGVAEYLHLSLEQSISIGSSTLVNSFLLMSGLLFPLVFRKIKAIFLNVWLSLEVNQLRDPIHYVRWCVKTVTLYNYNNKKHILKLLNFLGIF